MNTQPIEKQVRHDGWELAVNSIFHTIQGEGPFAGTPAIFVRLAGCNLQCPMCDTEYSRRLNLPVEEIVERVSKARPHTPDGYWIAPTNLVVISGGEPFRQPLTNLVRALLDAGYVVQIETNGTLFEEGFPYGLVTVVCSPKAGAVNKRLQKYIHSYKYVATAESLQGSPDGLPMHALEHPNGGALARPHSGFQGTVYLQPVDEKNPTKNSINLYEVVQSCLRYGHRLCIQIHKIIGVE